MAFLSSEMSHFGELAWTKPRRFYSFLAQALVRITQNTPTGEKVFRREHGLFFTNFIKAVLDVVGWGNLEGRSCVFLPEKAVLKDIRSYTTLLSVL